MATVDVDPPELWHAVRQDEVATWRGTGWDTAGAGAVLLAHGFRTLDETADGLVVQPLPVWQLPPDPGLDEPLRPAYDCARRASLMLAGRQDLGEAAELLAESNRLLDASDASAQTHAAVAGWFSRSEPSLLFRTVERIRPASAARARLATPAATGLEVGGWRDAFVAPDHAVRAGLADLQLLSRADDWPGMRYLRRSLAAHPLAADARYLCDLLSTVGSLDELAAHPRPDLVPGGGSGNSDPTAAVLRWGVVGPELLRRAAVRPDPPTGAVVVLDAVARLTRIALDLHAPATLRQVLGHLTIGAQT